MPKRADYLKVPKLLHIATSCLAAIAVFFLGFNAHNIYSHNSTTNKEKTEFFLQDTEPHEVKELLILPIVKKSKQFQKEKTLDLKNIVDMGLEWFKQASNGQKVFTTKKVFSPHALKNQKKPCKEIEEITQQKSQTIPAGSVLVSIVDSSVSCGYGGLASIKGNWAIVMGWDTTENTISQYVLIHELGHVLGLPHAQRYDCPILTDDTLSENCELVEYGDQTDPMGKPLADITPTFNAVLLNELNWGNGKYSIVNPGTHEFVLRPPGQKTRTKKNSPDYYLIGNIAISYRGRDLLDLGDSDTQLKEKTTKKYEGVYLHKITKNKNTDMSQTTLMPFTKNEIAGKKDFHYISPRRDFAIHIDEIMPNSQGAKVTVIVAEPNKQISDTWGPVIRTRAKTKDTNPVIVAWMGLDPSGVSHYDVEYQNKRRLIPADGNRALYLKRTKEPIKVTIKAYDIYGNETTETLTIGPKKITTRL